MPKSLPPLPSSQAPGPGPTHAVWPQWPIDRRQQCHELLAHLLIHISHRAPSEECNYEHQDWPEPSPT